MAASSLTIKQIAQLRRSARTALEQYGMSNATLTFLQGCKQPAYRVQQSRANSLGDKPGYKAGTYLLRMFPTVQRSPRLVRSELVWLRALHDDAQLLVPDPVANSTGRLITAIRSPGNDHAFSCAVTRWVEGRFRLRKDGPGPSSLRSVGGADGQDSCSWPTI